jgi:hypothetical protein
VLPESCLGSTLEARRQPPEDVVIWGQPANQAALTPGASIAGTSGPIADPLKVRTQVELGRHHLDSALAALAKQGRNM